MISLNSKWYHWIYMWYHFIPKRYHLDLQSEITSVWLRRNTQFWFLHDGEGALSALNYWQRLSSTVLKASTDLVHTMLSSSWFQFGNSVLEKWMFSFETLWIDFYLFCQNVSGFTVLEFPGFNLSSWFWLRLEVLWWQPWYQPLNHLI